MRAERNNYHCFPGRNSFGGPFCYLVEFSQCWSACHSCLRPLSVETRQAVELMCLKTIYREWGLKSDRIAILRTSVPSKHTLDVRINETKNVNCLGFANPTDPSVNVCDYVFVCFWFRHLFVEERMSKPKSSEMKLFNDYYVYNMFIWAVFYRVSIRIL